MGRGSSGHIASGGSGYFYHNDRSHETKNSIFTDEKNEYSCSANDAMILYRTELSKRTQAYTSRTNQKLQKNIVTHRSMIINLEQHHTLDDLKKVKEWLEVSLDTKVLQIAIHRDEGHIDKDSGKVVKNYHAHIEMMGIDSYGISIAQHQVKKLKTETKEEFEKRAEKFQHTRANRLDSKFYTKMQTFLANTLEMERGKRGSKAKRLDTYEYKREAEKIATEKRATIAQVKAQFRQEKQTLISTHKATKEDYTILRKKYKELEEKARKKDLAIAELEIALEEKEESLSGAVETQEQLRSHALNYQRKYLNATTELEEKKAELAKKPTVEYVEIEKPIEVIKEVENPINRELEKKANYFEKKYTKALKTLQEINTLFKAKDFVELVDKIKIMFAKEEKEVGEVGEKEAWNNLMDGVNKTLASDNPKLQ